MFGGRRLVPKSVRLHEFLTRLAAAPAAAALDEAFRQLSDVLNAVEDELTEIPFNPDSWQSDGRMYPPQEDNRRSVPEKPGTVRYRTRQHNIFISADGAITIEDVVNSVKVFEKAGANGSRI